MPSGPRGYFTLVLHAHLPWVYEPAYERYLEEHWFFEAMNETYLPLLVMLRRLRDRGVPFKLALSISPTLLAMMEHGDLIARFASFHESLRRLTEAECAQWEHEPELSRVTQMYRWLFAERWSAFESCAGRIFTGFLELAQQGCVELYTTAATHPFLPNLQDFPLLTRQLVEHGRAAFARMAGYTPAGMWLPESGYYPGLEDTLAACGVRHFQLESHGILHAEPRPLFAVYAPVFTPAGVAAFGRHAEASKAVWSADEGYPGDPVYREFYRDVGWDADSEHIRQVLPPDGSRLSTGLKYYAVTDRRLPLSERAHYNPEAAMLRAGEHARHYVSLLKRHAAGVAARLPQPPLLFCPFDAELFGHWWFEGIAFIEQVFAHLAEDGELEAVTPSQYLERHPVQQVVTPNMSSWGERGFSQFWVNQRTEWLYPHQLAAAARFERMLRDNWRFDDWQWRRLRTELFLALSSDFPFMITAGGYGGYSARRLKEHLHFFHRLADDLGAGRDISWYEPYWAKRPQIF